MTDATPNPGLEASVERLDGCELVTARGEVDIATTPRLREVIDQALARSSDALVIDLTGVTFMESTGLRAMLEARLRAEAEGRSLAVVCKPGGPVHRLFELTNTTESLRVCGSRDEAVAGFSS